MHLREVIVIDVLRSIHVNEEVHVEINRHLRAKAKPVTEGQRTATPGVSPLPAVRAQFIELDDGDTNEKADSQYVGPIAPPKPDDPSVPKGSAGPPERRPLFGN